MGRVSSGIGRGPLEGARLRQRSEKPSFELVITRTLAPKKLAELTALEQKQLEAGAEAYDGKKASAEERIDAFRGFVDKTTKKPAYVVLSTSRHRLDLRGRLRHGDRRHRPRSLECDDQELRAALLEVVGEATPKKKTAKKKNAAKKR